MTTSSPDDAVPDESEAPVAGEDAAPSARAPDTQADDSSVLPRWVHRWKDEGGALHPHD